MNQEDAEEYTQSLGQIVAGSWRQIALAKRLGVPQALGLSVEQWVSGRLGGYIKMSIPDRHKAVQDLTAEGHSTREIGEILGVSHGTVGNDVQNLTPIDAIAALAATEKVHRAAKNAEKEEARKIVRENSTTNENGCTVEDLNLLIQAGRKFKVIYADPPWEFKVYSGKGKTRSADRHYDTQSLDFIKAIPVAQLADDDCALFLWGVWPELPGALDVIAAWGFTYKTLGFVWVKENEISPGLHWGMGYWTRANSEPCLLATKGAPKREAKDVHQVILSPVSEHSRKPDEAQVRIERLLPGPYLELFARRPVSGWTVWGNQIERNLLTKDIMEFAA